jgi:ribosomal protein S18 acetylase RimI-like enzyme
MARPVSGCPGGRAWLDGAVLIRDALPDELPAIGELRVRAYVTGGFLSPDSGYAPRLRALGTHSGGSVLVAVAADGQAAPAAGTAVGTAPIVGTIMLVSWPDTGEVVTGPGEAEIRALAVAPGTQGQGIGRALLGAVLERAARQGTRALVLSTQPEMRAAHRLYERAGFTRLPDRDWSPEPGVNLLVYGLTLTG